MRFYKHIILLAVLPLLFASCADEVTNNYYKGPENSGKLDANINYGEMETKIIHRVHFDPSYVSHGYLPDHEIGMKLMFKLDDKSKKDKVNKLIMTSEYYAFEFDKQELAEAYRDSIGGYVFDFVPFYEMQYYSYLLWNVKIYGSSGENSNEYPFMARHFFIYSPQSSSSWINSDTMEVTLLYNNQISDKSAAETHFLNIDGKETGVYNSVVFDSKFKIAGIPPGTVKYYFKITNTYDGKKGLFISKIFEIQ